jgi:hypothetical protein
VKIKWAKVFLRIPSGESFFGDFAVVNLYLRYSFLTCTVGTEKSTLGTLALFLPILKVRCRVPQGRFIHRLLGDFCKCPTFQMSQKVSFEPNVTVHVGCTMTFGSKVSKNRPKIIFGSVYKTALRLTCQVTDFLIDFEKADLHHTFQHFSIGMVHPACLLSTEALQHFLRFSVGRRWQARRLMVLRRKPKRIEVINRAANTRRDRASVLLKIAGMSDAYFKRMFRLDRPTFYWLLDQITPQLQRCEAQAHRSSGSAVSPTIKLATALRFLAGGVYLDLAFAFNVSYKHVTKYVWEAAEAIDRVLNNIQFPLGDEQKLRDLEQGFLSISKGLFPGTVAAGDGVVFRIQRPPKAAVGGDVSSFFTRKGYYAYGMQAFVDASCRFVSISMKMCASTHDSTAYAVSDLARAIREGKLASWAHIVLDEAYTNRPQELSPFKGRNLDIWRDSFNYHPSLHRQVVERAFGLLVQRWGVFWRPLRCAFHRIPLLIRVCCKLHNLCIERFGAGLQIGIARGDVRVGDMDVPGSPASSGRRQLGALLRKQSLHSSASRRRLLRRPPRRSSGWRPGPEYRSEEARP